MWHDRIGKLTILRELGAGAGSRVFHIRREADAHEYALKVVPVDSRRRKYFDQARHEFRIAGMFDHPNLVKAFVFETESSWLFRARKAKLLLEYAPGNTLDRLPPLRPARLARVFDRVADALAHMHEHGVCHADLKPSNLILGSGADVKVIDYGLAWVKGEPKGRLQGTPEYMAPETQARTVIDERTDIFNLGATLYRLVTRRSLPVAVPGLVFDEKTYRSAVIPVGKLNPDAPVELCELIHWCIEYAPEHRPAQATCVQRALAELADEWEANERR